MKSVPSDPRKAALTQRAWVAFGVDVLSLILPLPLPGADKERTDKERTGIALPMFEANLACDKRLGASEGNKSKRAKSARPRGTQAQRCSNYPHIHIIHPPGMPYFVPLEAPTGNFLPDFAGYLVRIVRGQVI
jgi:hypothetical protein